MESHSSNHTAINEPQTKPSMHSVHKLSKLPDTNNPALAGGIDKLFNIYFGRIFLSIVKHDTS